MNEKTWLMEPERLLVMFARLRALGASFKVAPQELAQARELAAQALRKVAGKVAILPVHGLIEQRMSDYGYWFGSFPTEFGEQALDALLANRQVEAIVLDIDSPGGTSYGVEEFADKIYAARQVKPIHALANSMAASAAYWIASAAGGAQGPSFNVTPGGDVGSVGVYSMHADWSKNLEEAGIKVTIAKAGKYKAEFSPYAPLSKEAQDYQQEMVDACYTKFVKAVARNRGVSVKDVRDTFGEGRLVMADAALAAGMVDRIITLGELLEKLSGGGGSTSARSAQEASVEILRLRHEQRQRLAERWRGLDGAA